MDWSKECFTSTDPSQLPEWAKKPLTFGDLEKMIESLPPPPPPADKSRCANCKEPMEQDGQPVYADFASAGPPFYGMPLGPPACYVCGRCYYLLKLWATKGSLYPERGALADRPNSLRR